MTIDKLPPHDLAAERDILGACLLDADALTDCLSKLRAEDFYSGHHRLIFSAMCGLRDSDKPVDSSTVRSWLADTGDLEAVGGPAALAELLAVPTVSGAMQSVQRIKSLAQLRGIISAAIDAQRAAHELGANPAELLAATTARLAELEEGAGGQSDNIAEALRSIFANLDGKPQPDSLLRTGIFGLDAKLCGLAPGDFVVIAAPTGGGKSTLALNFCRHFCAAGVPVLVASYEMSREQIARTICAQVAQVCVTKAGGYPEHRADAIASALDDIAAWPFFVVDQPYSVQELTSKVRWYVQKQGVKVTLVDYLQLIPTREQTDNREGEVASVSRNLKRCARATKSVIIACTQLNDQGLTRESRAISHDADVMLKIIDTEGNDGTGGLSRHCQVRVEKNRDGDTGAVEVCWERGYRTFRDWVPGAPENNP